MTHTQLRKELPREQLEEFYTNHLRNIDNKLKLINHPDMGGLIQVDIVTSQEGEATLKLYRKLIEKQLDACSKSFLKRLRSRL
jgi:hypothetical protein